MKMSHSNHRLKILLLEDNPYDMELTEAFLKANCRCELHMAKNVESFQTAMRKGEPDLVISDFRLHGFDGLIALKMARQKFPGVPFVFCSGDANPQHRAEALALGASEFINKDDAFALLGLIRRVAAKFEPSADAHAVA